MSKNEAQVCYMRAYMPDGVLEKRIEMFPCRIGRQNSNDITLADPSISSLHAMLTRDEEGGSIHLEDQFSTNGMFRDGQKVQSVVIDHPQRIVMGRIYVDFALNEEELDVLPPLQGQTVPPKQEKKETPGDWHNKELEELAASPVNRSATFTRGNANSAHRGIICPHCWHSFDVSEFLFIARHQSLMGDPVLGADAAQRFLPSRFTPEGNAIDAAGMSCPDMACPHCHLRIPQAAAEMPPLFLSIVGATASGKSYFLTSMTWNLRNTLSRDFAISFTDTDAVNNQILNEFEETVFLASDQDSLVALRKTELQGELYNQVLLDNMLINLPSPFLFTVAPAEHHPMYEKVKDTLSRTLVLYDNAGEHFEPGMDSVENPTTQHLLHSDTIFFLFDPTKDVRFRRRIKGVDDPQLSAAARVQRQEIILTEMINRIKKYSGMRSGQKSRKTLVVVLSKYDTWRSLLSHDLPEEPWKWDGELNTCALDVPLLKNVSFELRMLLDELCPEIVSTAETFAGEVLYLPNSALGHSPELDEETGLLGIHPRDIEPFWATVPMLYFLCQHGFIKAAAPEKHENYPDVKCRLSGDIFFVEIPGRRKPLQVPHSFAGCQLQCPGTDIWFTVPGDNAQ